MGTIRPGSSPSPAAVDQVVLKGSEADALCEPDVADVDRHHQHLENRLPLRTARVRAPFRWKPDAVRLHIVKRELRRGKSAGNVHAVVMPAKQEILTEEEVLYERVCLDRTREV